LLCHKTCLTAIVCFTQQFVRLSFNVTFTKVLAYCIMLIHAFLQPHSRINTHIYEKDYPLLVKILHK